MRRWTRSLASNQSASVSGLSSRWPLNSARSGRREKISCIAFCHPASSPKTLCRFHVNRSSSSSRWGSGVTLNHPEHVLTLTSIMSGPNGDDQVRPTDEGTAVLMAPAPDTREERIAVGLWAKQKLLGSADPFNEQYEALRITRAIDRAYHPAGFVRQLQAIMAANGRLARLAHVRVPTLVIHGADDILVPVENGRNVAAAIPGARYV